MDMNETIIRLAQGCLRETPVMVFGSGASLKYGVGSMAQLGQCLSDSVTPDGAAERDTWLTFTAKLKDTGDLESTLQEVTLPPSLLSAVVMQTRRFILGPDLELFDKVRRNTVKLGHARLFRHLFNSTNRTIEVVTTNYDRLAEYAADACSVAHYTGFSSGYFRHFHPSGRNPWPPRNGRTVNIWKVHGSLDWFSDDTNTACALPCSAECPDGLTPLVVTPGVHKYEITHQEPFRSVIANADAALMGAKAYLCVGYGFNDSHIQPKLVERTSRDNVPIAVLARTLTAAAKHFITQSCHAAFVAFEQSGTGTKVYVQGHTDGIDVPDCALWDLDGFLDATLGVS